MAIPLAPIAVVALRYGAVAITAYAVSRKISQSQTNQRTEDALDDVEEGVSAHRAKDREQINASARYRRVVRLRALRESDPGGRSSSVRICHRGRRDPLRQSRGRRPGTGPPGKRRGIREHGTSHRPARGRPHPLQGQQGIRPGRPHSIRSC